MKAGGGTRFRGLAPAATIAVLALAGCAEPTQVDQPAAAPAASSPAPSAVPTARQGAPAKSTRIRFLPTELVLPGGAKAPVDPARTVDGELEVPENVRRVGWWDGSAYAGDPFGNTVIAGHVDSASEGIGFFARLLKVREGEVVTVRDGAHAQRYRISKVTTVAKRALASDSRAFDQAGPHRLVLITCTGDYRPERGGYESNLVITAQPLGRAT